VTDLQFVYYYRNTAAAAPLATATSWDSSNNVLTGSNKNYDSFGNELIPDGLPNAVEVSITIQSRDGTQQKTFTDFIRIPGAK
jgi:hypothetical protein